MCTVQCGMISQYTVHKVHFIDARWVTSIVRT